MPTSDFRKKYCSFLPMYSGLCSKHMHPTYLSSMHRLFCWWIMDDVTLFFLIQFDRDYWARRKTESTNNICYDPFPVYLKLQEVNLFVQGNIYCTITDTKSAELKSWMKSLYRYLQNAISMLPVFCA